MRTKSLKMLCTMVCCISAIASFSACGSSAAGGKTEIKFFNGKTESVKFMDKVISDFNAHNDKYQVVQEFQKDASNALQQKFASGDVPDVVSADITQDYISNGLFADLSGEKYFDTMDPSVKQMLTDVDSGKQYKVALTKSIGGIFYNKDLVSSINTDTLEDFVNSIKSTKSGITPMLLGGKDSWTLGQLMEFWGHGIIKQDFTPVEAKKIFTKNDQKTLEFASKSGPISTFAQRLLDLQSSGIINQNAATTSYDDQIADFAAGKAICIPQGIWAVSLIKEKNPDINIGFAPFAPMNDGGKPVVLSAEDSTLGIPSKSKNIDGAKAFISYLLKPENLKKYSETLHLPSAFKDIDSKWIDDPQTYEDVLAKATPIGFTSYPSGFSSDDSGRYVQALLSGQYKTANDFTTAYAQAWNKAADSSK